MPDLDLKPSEYRRIGVGPLKMTVSKRQLRIVTWLGVWAVAGLAVCGFLLPSTPPWVAYLIALGPAGVYFLVLLVNDHE